MIVLDSYLSFSSLNFSLVPNVACSAFNSRKSRTVLDIGRSSWESRGSPHCPPGILWSLVEQIFFDGNMSRRTDYRPVLRKIVFWQAYYHSCEAGHGKPHPRLLNFSDLFSDPFPMHLLGTINHRTESAKKGVCFMSGTTATVVVNHRSQQVLLLHFGATVFHED